MMWLAWRQVRAPARLVLATAIIVVGLLGWTGPQLAHRFRTDGLAACVAGSERTNNPAAGSERTNSPAAGAAAVEIGGSTGQPQAVPVDRTCGDLTTAFLGRFSILSVFGSVLPFLPAVAGTFGGAPLIAREYESGTHHLAWAQSVSRTRWLAVKLAVVGGLAIGLTAVASLAYTWWSSSRDRLGSRLAPEVFSQRGVVPIAYVTFAVALGVAIGSVARRVLPAMALTLLVVVVVLFGVQRWVRPHIIEPVELRYPTYSFYADEPPDRVATQHGWMLSNLTVDRAGHILSPAGELSDAKVAQVCGIPPDQMETRETKRLLDECGDRLGLMDVAQVHPADRFWPMQAAESGLYIAASLPLFAFSFWKIRRRPG